MKRFLLPVTALLLLPFYCFGWGAEGHKMVADIAKAHLDPGVEARVQKYLDSTSFEEASVWMDQMRADHSYDYMKPWHYVDVEHDASYVPNPKGDAVSELNKVIVELKNYRKMKAADVKTDIEILFHLCGDITQPLHCGYGSDRGGNSIKLMCNGQQTNLHHVWDTDIILTENITLDTCLAVAKEWTPSQLKQITKVDVLAWMNDSRVYLPQVYSFKNGAADADYMKRNTPIVEQQLAKGGLRLAAVLNMIFGDKAKAQ